MNTVVITGSARGLGYEMAKVFKKSNYNVVISDLNIEALQNAKYELNNIVSDSKVEAIQCDVTCSDDIERLIEFAKTNFEKIDIWINNAGVNQPEKPIWELNDIEIQTILDVDLKGAIIGSKLAMKEMLKQMEQFIMLKDMVVMMR